MFLSEAEFCDPPFVYMENVRGFFHHKTKDQTGDEEVIIENGMLKLTLRIFLALGCTFFHNIYSKIFDNKSLDTRSLLICLMRLIMVYRRVGVVSDNAGTSSHNPDTVGRERIVFWAAKRGMTLPPPPTQTHANAKNDRWLTLPTGDKLSPYTRCRDSSQEFAPLMAPTVRQAISDLVSFYSTSIQRILFFVQPPFEWLDQ